MTPPRFIPFADMTKQEQREHLWRVHRIETSSVQDWDNIHTTDHSPYFGMPHAVTPHTHDKPARTRTEENT